MIWKRGTGLFSETKRIKIGKTGTAVLLSAVLLSSALPLGSAASILLCPLSAQAAAVEETEDASAQETGNASEVLNTDVEGEISHNEVEIDPYTGLPISDEEGESMAAVRLTSEVTYDPNTEFFTERFGSGDGETVSCTAANGMITNGPVTMKTGDGVTVKMFRNGAEQEEPVFTGIKEPGNYAVRIYSASGNDLGTYAFRIINSMTNISEYVLPETFTLDSVIVNGYSLWTSGRSVSFEDEGQYSIFYHNEETGVQYSLSMTVDHTAPVLALAAVNENNVARSAVDISDQEEGTTLTVLCDGDRVTANGVLTNPGRYQLTLKDEAGNVTTYAFTIYMYITLSSAIVIGLLVACQIGLIVYMVVSRKKARVR